MHPCISAVMMKWLEHPLQLRLPTRSSSCWMSRFLSRLCQVLRAQQP
jgi:hypothetical protein